MDGLCFYVQCVHKLVYVGEKEISQIITKKTHLRTIHLLLW
jgi:hypothetical protein